MKKLGAIIAIAIILGTTACGSSKKAAVQTTSSSARTTSAAGSSDCPKADGSEAKKTKFTEKPPMCIDVNKKYSATMETDAGTIKIDFDAAAAPETVNNFVYLSRFHYYDDLTFHRVIQGFVVQGGDPTGTGSGGPGYEFKDELPKSASAYKKGTLAMANSGPDTNGSQFYFVLSDNPGLQPLYSVFGNVTSGMDVLQKIEADGGTGQEGTPAKVHKITKVTITES